MDENTLFWAITLTFTTIVYLVDLYECVRKAGTPGEYMPSTVLFTVCALLLNTGLLIANFTIGLP